MVANSVESKQAYFSSTVSSVTSETAGWLVKQLCNESDSCTPCHDTDLNIKPCSMQLAEGCHSLAIYLQVRWSPVIKVTAFCFLFFIFFWNTLWPKWRFKWDRWRTQETEAQSIMFMDSLFSGRSGLCGACTVCQFYLTFFLSFQHDKQH